MAQIIPPITSLPVDSSAAPSVEDIQDRLPSICVDYLSHDWTEEDVWASWRSMTRHKHEIANGVRLENASWRTWNKQRNKLATISPETLNWLKDSDVTWLYGPLHTANVEPVRPLKQSTTDERYGIDRPSGMKPILKHRTLSELLTIPNPASPILESVSGDDLESLDGESIASVSSGRPHLLQTKSDTNIVRNKSTPSRRRSPPRHPISAQANAVAASMGMGPSGSGSGVGLDALNPDDRASPDGSGSGSKRHISFNTFVEQCVAVDAGEAAGDSSFGESPDSEDDMLEMRSVSSRSSRSSSHSRPSMSRHSSSGSGSEHLTIAKIAPTMLKTTGSYQSTNPGLPQMVYQPPAEYRSPQSEVPPPASPFDFPSPQIGSQQRWQSAGGFGASAGRGSSGDADDDGYGSVGFDYFGGPDLSSSHGVPPSGYGRAPAVNQPPAQPKWRQSQSQQQQPSPVPAASSAPSQAQDDLPTSLGSSLSPPRTGPEPSSANSSFSFGASPSSSSSNSSLNGIGSPQPQPGRSILKVRTPNVGNSNEPASPPSYFNYTPSVATGIGGMRGSYDSPPGNSLGAASSPLMSPPMPSGAPIAVPSPSVDDGGRGRSTARGQGSSQFDRSTSRGTSVSSTSSISSQATAGAAARSPVDTSSGVRSRVHAAGAAQQAQGTLDKVEEGTPWSPPAARSPPARSPPASASSTTNQRSSVQAQAKGSAPSSSRSPPASATSTASVPAPRAQPAPSASPVVNVTEDDGASHDYIPERSSTPTPHSSPQIALRSLKDTSPASLPHTSTRTSSAGSDLPRTDPATSSGSSSRATVAHVPTNAQPTIAQPAPTSASSQPTGAPRVSPGLHAPARSGHNQVPGAYDDEGDDAEADGTDGDGSTLIGRAANIANTAKDLLGALWYGEDQRRAAAAGGVGAVGQGMTGHGGHGVVSGPASGAQSAQGTGQTKRHGRGASLG